MAAMNEDTASKKIDLSLMRRLVSALRPYRRWVIFSTVLTIVASALGPYRASLTKDAINATQGLSSIDSLTGILMLIAVVLVSQGVLQYALALVMQWIGQSTVFDIRKQIYELFQRLNLRYYDTNPVGRLVTRVTSDVEVLNEVFSSGIVTIVADIFVIIWIVVFMFATNWKLASATIVVLPFLLWATAIFRRNVRSKYKDIRIQVAKMNTFLNEFISGIGVVQLFNRQPEQRAIFADINEKHTEAQVKTVSYYAVFFPVVEFLSNLAIAIMIVVAMGDVLQGALSPGEVVAFILYFEMFFRPIRELSEKYNTLQNAMVSSERIFSLLDHEQFVPDAADAVDFVGLRQGIEIRDLHFAYDGSNMVLHGVSLSIPKGKTVAIVGHTGAGKSSIINVLTRFYEYQAGEVLVDGVSLRLIRQKSFRRKLAIVLQDVFLFSRSIADNISLGTSGISREAIENAGRAVGIHDFVMQLPRGYDTVLSERGSTLSTGQKQLLSFARALAHDPELLILDEATANVDTATELLIEEATATLLKGRTSIVIAHRLSTIRNADTIVVMHHGRVHETGTHDELLRKGGLYAKLYTLQQTSSAA